jgi:hypothetical protein
LQKYQVFFLDIFAGSSAEKRGFQPTHAVPAAQKPPGFVVLTFASKH